MKIDRCFLHVPSWPELLYGSLDLVWHRLSELGQHDAALPAAESLGFVLCDWPHHGPECVSQWVASLNKEADTLGELDRWEEALTAIERAVRWLRNEADSTKYGHRTSRAPLARNLEKHGAILSKLGCHKEAQEATDEAALIMRYLHRFPGDKPN